MPDNEQKTTHPSFGLVSLSRTTHGGPGTPLFGSSINHGHTMRLTIDEAEVTRNLSYDHFFPKGHLIEIEMSPAQFAELITSANIGPGTPCTLRWIRGKGSIPSCPIETKRAQFEREFDETVKDVTTGVAKLLAKIKQIGEKKTLVKADKEELKDVADTIERELRANLPFILSQWNEQMDKTVTEAKAEAEAYFSRLVEAAGLKHLETEIRQQLPTINDSRPLQAQLEG